MAVLAFAASSELRAQPEMRGPHTVGTFEPGQVSVLNVMIPTRVYFPSDLTARVPVVLVMHGYNRNGNYMVEMGQTLASHGMVAIVPSMPCSVLGGCNHVENADQVSALIAWAIDQSANVSSSPIYMRVDGTRRGAIGHSWGGLAVMLAASRDPELDSVLMLDPNDDQRAGAMAAPNAMMPTAALMAENRGACNSTDWGNSVYPMTPAPHLRIRVRGSGHCDPEEPSDNACPLFCGSGDRATTPLFRRYAVAWTSCILQGDPAMAAYIGGASMDSDAASGALDMIDQAGLDQLPCRAAPVPPLPPDAGMIAEDAAAPMPDSGAVVEADAGVAADAAPPQPSPDAGEPDAGANLPSPPDAGSRDASVNATGGAQAGGCVCVPSRSKDAGVLVLLLLGLMLIRHQDGSRSRQHQSPRAS